MTDPGEEDGRRAPARVRMDAIATLPVFFKLAGKRAVVAGGTPPATWKAELLSAAGASVEVYAGEPCVDMAELAARPPGGPIRLVPRAWRLDDLAGAAIAIGDVEEDHAEAFRDAAHRHGVPVNVIDKPAFCDFQFGTVVSRSPLVIGISTDGAAPVFGQAVRARIEALLPQGLGAWARAARDWRPAVQLRQPIFRARRRFWERFSEIAFRSPHDTPTEADRERCIEAMTEGQVPAQGTLSFVGAGPGDPDAVTLLAIRRLQAADVVIHDADVDPAVVGLARREALKVALSSADLEGAVSSVSAWLGDGRVVAWLGAGNPRTCLRWRQRWDALSSSKTTIDCVEGLGTCSTCGPHCPAFDRRASSLPPSDPSRPLP